MMLKNKEISENLTVMQKLSLLAGQMEGGLPFFDVTNLVQKNKESAGGIAYPSLYSMANSWNTELIGKVSTELALRDKKNNLNIAITPNVGVKMNVYSNGMSEDPYFCGKLASAYKKGIAKAGVMPVLSSCSIDSNDAQFMDLEVNKSIIRDYIARPFEIALIESEVGAVMSSDLPLEGNYHDINFNLINKILQDKNYFKMPCVCEVSNADSVAKCLHFGSSPLINCQVKYLEEAYNNYLDLKKSLENGTVTPLEFETACNNGTVLTETTINAAVEKFSSFTCECEKCANLAATDDKSVFQADNLSYQAAIESIVLLKNANQTLPLSKNTRVAVIGQLAAFKNANSIGFVDSVLLAKENLPFVFNGFSEGYALSEQRNDDLIAEACAHANSSDAVLLFLGFGEDEKAQTTDIQNLKLPVNQLALIDALGKTGKKIIAILFGDVQFDTSFDDDCCATLLIPNGGTYSNDALLKVLSGEFNPSGRLAYTLYDNPDEIFADLKKRKDLGRIKVGPFFGYRYYDTAGVKVKYPFGHGLSYTRFSYSKIKADVGSVQFCVKNTGTKAGFETVQIYIGKKESNVARPFKELRGFNKVYLEPGQSKVVHVNVNYSNYAFPDPKDGARKVEEGEYTVCIGASVTDVRLKKSFKVEGCKFDGKKESLSDYLPTESNIIRKRYTMQTENKDKQKISKATIAFVLIILLAGLYDIIIAITGSFDFLTLLILLVLNLLIPVAIVGLIREGKKGKKQSLVLEEINASNPENETELTDEPALEKLFLDEFAEKEEKEEIAPPIETVELPFDEKLTLKTIADGLLIYMSARGLGVDASSVRAVFSALYASRMVILKSTDFSLLEEFIAHLCACFGTSAYSDELFNGRENLLFYTDENNQVTETATAKAISGAAVNKQFVHIATLKGADFPQAESLLMPIVTLTMNPEQEHVLLPSNQSNTDKIYAIPSNLWFVLTPSQADGLDGLSPNIAENAFVVDVQLHKTKKKKEQSAPASVNILQFLKLCENSEKSILVNESLYKKLDRLEEAVNTRAPYHIGNKEWRRIEKFVSVFLACDGTEADAAVRVAGAKLLPKMMPLIKANPAKDENDFSFTFKKIFGDESKLL